MAGILKYGYPKNPFVLGIHLYRCQRFSKFLYSEFSQRDASLKVNASRLMYTGCTIQYISNKPSSPGSLFKVYCFFALNK